MFSWMNQDEIKKKSIELSDSVLEGLKDIYKTKVLPLETYYRFHDFHSAALDDSDFDARPMILLVGQYSTGKTTFIRYLLERDFPGMRVGPEPTTDGFIAVMYGETEGIIPGNALVVDSKKPFKTLSKHGNAFLNRFQCSQVNSSVVKTISIIDTPGILSGEKQHLDRGYNFTGVLEWFAERVDKIILLFDAHKLDISDEFRRSIEALRGHDYKIRIMLNKADMVDHQQLMRVYGALMWSLGKVINTPEVARVYIGSFWNEPLCFDVNKRRFRHSKETTTTGYKQYILSVSKAHHNTLCCTKQSPKYIHRLTSYYTFILLHQEGIAFRGKYHLDIKGIQIHAASSTSSSSDLSRYWMPIPMMPVQDVTCFLIASTHSGRLLRSHLHMPITQHHSMRALLKSMDRLLPS
ncbi:EH domain-containing protein 4 [Halocaridina rubra]|uniref:EH domain-containing protein 4 n=1 Tax=Halocaridina rubra TaxID=373956 RepID=A0AAN8WJF7_HALRR